MNLLKASLLFTTLISYSLAHGEGGAVPIPMKSENIKPTQAEKKISDDKAEEEQGTEINDPLEPLNRGIYMVNSVVDGLVMKPVAIAYRLLLPQPIRDSAGNFYRNIKSPISFCNHLLQWEPRRAGNSLARFVINSTCGILGMFDAADEIGFKSDETNFNETLAVWGINTGPYLIIPVLGPSSFRRVVGIGGDYFMQPINYYFMGDRHEDDYWASLTLTGVDLTHQRNEVLEAVDDVIANALDPYATFRSVYFQKQTARLKELKGKKV